MSTKNCKDDIREQAAQLLAKSMGYLEDARWSVLKAVLSAAGFWFVALCLPLYTAVFYFAAGVFVGCFLLEGLTLLAFAFRARRRAYRLSDSSHTLSA